MSHTALSPKVVIVTGLPCTGKTTLARQVAERFRLPLVAKDDFKELLFETLGWSDRAWSKKLGYATYAIMYHVLETELKAGRSLVVESNFASQTDTPRFLAIGQRCPFMPFQIELVTAGPTLVERFRARSNSGIRHPGHVDHLNQAEFEATLAAGGSRRLGLPGPYVALDTTDFNRLDTGLLYAQLAQFLAE